MSLTPDVPGRGAWGAKGGLLPLRPGGPGPWYYRAGIGDEPDVGTTFLTGADKGDSGRCVHLGVIAIQRRLNDLMGYHLVVDGWYGKATGSAVAAFQAHNGLVADKTVGPATMRSLLTPLVEAVAAGLVAPGLLGGIALVESGLDPGAVGVTTPFDHGLVQINLAPGVHDDVLLMAAMDPGYALSWAVKELVAAHGRWIGHTVAGVDPWAVAVLNHNSPVNAAVLARTGAYPSVQAGGYVRAVMDAATDW